MSRLLHHLRGHKIRRERRHWYDPPGETPRGPYDWYICSCQQEWVVGRSDPLGPPETTRVSRYTEKQR